MAAAIEKFISGEKAWIKEESSAQKKKLLKKQFPIIFLAVEAVWVALAVLSGGDFSIVIRNLLFGLCLFIVMALLLYLFECSAYSSYMKMLSKAIFAGFKSEELKESFARDMLGIGTAKPEVFEWLEEKRPVSFFCGQHFAMLRKINAVTIVNLDLVDRVEIDAQKMTYHTSNVTMRYTVYPMCFFYKHQQQENKRKKDNPDVVIQFSSRNIRDEVLELLTKEKSV